jgi:hypothetical protein
MGRWTCPSVTTPTSASRSARLQSPLMIRSSTWQRRDRQVDPERVLGVDDTRRQGARMGTEMRVNRPQSRLIQGRRVAPRRWFGSKRPLGLGVARCRHKGRAVTLTSVELVIVVAQVVPGTSRLIVVAVIVAAFLACTVLMGARPGGPGLKYA